MEFYKFFVTFARTSQFVYMGAYLGGYLKQRNIITKRPALPQASTFPASISRVSLAHAWDGLNYYVHACQCQNGKNMNRKAHARLGAEGVGVGGAWAAGPGQMFKRRRQQYCDLKTRTREQTQTALLFFARNRRVEWARQLNLTQPRELLK